MARNPSRSVGFHEKLRLWRTMFIHRWHAPQTIGELHGRPSVGMRFEHINHRESLAQYLWRYGAFAENEEGTGRVAIRAEPPLKKGLQATIKELESQAPGLLSKAVEYAIFKYGAPDLTANENVVREHSLKLDELASEHPAIVEFADKLCQLHRNMLPFYLQMRYLTPDETRNFMAGRMPLLTPLHPTDETSHVGTDPVFVTGDPASALLDTFSQNIYNALCWRARAELFEVMESTFGTEKNGIWSIAIVNNEIKRFFVTDEALIKTLISLNEPVFPWLCRALATFKTAVSTMITAMPMFIIRNFFRDTLAGFVAGRYWQFPFLSTLNGAGEAFDSAVLGRDNVMRDYLLQGGFYSGLVESEVSLDAKVHGLSGNSPYHKAKKILKNLVHLLTRLAWFAEVGTRVSQYQRARAAGANKYEAIRAARMVSSDFANIGASRGWRMYVHTVPFLNASIQGFDQLYQICRPEYRSNPKESRWGSGRRQHIIKTLCAGACLAGMAFGGWLWNTSDDARLTQYLGETDYEKASYLTLYDISADTDIRIPVPFQIGAAFMKVPEISFDLVTKTETLAGERFVWSLIHGNLAISWLPAVLQPVWEVKTNRNFFGAPIIPGYMANWPATRQFFSRSTPEFLIQLGQSMGVSPLHIQTFIRGWTGHLGTLVVTSLDEMMWDTEKYGEKPFPRTFGLATGMAGILPPQFEARNRWSEEFYELANWADAWSRTDYDRIREAVIIKEIHGQVREYLRNIQTAIDAVPRRKSLSREKKEERITSLYSTRIRIMKNVLPIMRTHYNNWKQSQ